MKLYNKLRKRKTMYIFKQGRVFMATALITISILTTIYSVEKTEKVKPQNLPSISSQSQVNIELSCTQEVVGTQTQSLENPRVNTEHFNKISVYTTTSVHLRKNSDKSSDSIEVIPAYQIIDAYISDKEITDNWCYVSYNNKKGWVKSEYLRKYNENSYIDIPLEFQYQDLVKDLIEIYGLDIDEYFVYGMMNTESKFDNNARGSSGDTGILQIIPIAWDELYSNFCKEYPELSNSIINDATDKRSNITLGIYNIKQIRDRYNLQSVTENSSKILTTYNRGPGGAYNYYQAHGTYSTEYSKSILEAAEYIRNNKTYK